MASQWTPELKEEVTGLWKIHNASEIASILGKRGHTFSRNAVIGLMHRAGLTKATIQRPRVPKHERVRIPEGSLAFKVINGIKRKQKLAGMPGIDPEPFQCQDAADVIPLRLSLSDLERADGKCRWPYDALPDEPGEGSFRFCGHTCLEGSYCFSHTVLSIGRGTTSERRAADISKVRAA